MFSFFIDNFFLSSFVFNVQSSSFDESAPILPPKREKRSVNSSSRSRIESIRLVPVVDASRQHQDQNHEDENDNEKQIQLIVDDINHIIEDYTRELDAALLHKPTDDHVDVSSSSSNILPPLPPKRERSNYNCFCLSCSFCR